MVSKKSNRPLIDNCYQLKVAYLKDRGYFLEGAKRSGTITFGSGKKLLIVAFKLKLGVAGKENVYLLFDNVINGEHIRHVQKVNLIRKSSNLNIGFRYYFLCPISNKNATVLYKAPGSLNFMHRTAYKDRLYYADQLKSTQQKSCNYEEVKMELKELKKQLKHGKCRKGKFWTMGKIASLKEKLNRHEKNREKKLLIFSKSKGIMELTESQLNGDYMKSKSK
ncbi:MAG: hypothetical protein ABJF04_17230 [Reichenbachiella sp.]|uniref:hypothetical protein n=1 Tax=Reichenbachiella sp. TaxID=2184521 RepID=UPI003264CDE1